MEKHSLHLLFFIRNYDHNISSYVVQK